LTSGASGSFGECGEDLGGLRETTLALLRKDEFPVGEDVELAVRAGLDLGRVVRPVELGRETRGPAVVAASDGAEQDAQIRHARDCTHAAHAAG
jgi:hypothetical protein